MPFARSPSTHSKSLSTAQNEWAALDITLKNIGGDDSMAATVAFTMFMRQPTPDIARSVLAPYFQPIRQDILSQNFDLVGVWAHGLADALWQPRQYGQQSFDTILSLRSFLFEEGLSDIWLNGLLPRGVKLKSGEFALSRNQFSVLKPNLNWVLNENETWWGNWLATTEEYDSKRQAQVFLSDVARIDPSRATNPFFEHRPSQSSFAYAMSLRRHVTQKPVFMADDLQRFWGQLKREGQEPLPALVSSATLVPAVVTERNVQDILLLSKTDPDLEYALFRGVAALNRVADGFPTSHHHAMESTISNPEVQKFVENQCLPEHRTTGPFQDWMDRLALKARHQFPQQTPTTPTHVL